jgi:hypothetical protein
MKIINTPLDLYRFDEIIAELERLLEQLSASKLHKNEI